MNGTSSTQYHVLVFQVLNFLIRLGESQNLLNVHPSENCLKQSACIHFWEAICQTKRYKHSLNQGLLSLYKRHRDIESVLNDSLGLHNKP